MLVEQRTEAVDQAVGQAAAGALHGHSRAPHDDADALQPRDAESPGWRMASVQQTSEAGCWVAPLGTDHLRSAHVASPAARTASHPEAAPVTPAIHTCLEQMHSYCKTNKWLSPARPVSRPGHPPAAAAPGTALQKGCRQHPCYLEAEKRLRGWQCNSCSATAAAAALGNRSAQHRTDPKPHTVNKCSNGCPPSQQSQLCQQQRVP